MRGGFRIGSGRKKIIKHLSNYRQAVSLLDDSILDVVKKLISYVHDKDKRVSLKACEILAKKSLPDKLAVERESEGLKIEIYEGGENESDL